LNLSLKLNNYVDGLTKYEYEYLYPDYIFLSIKFKLIPFIVEILLSFPLI